MTESTKCLECGKKYDLEEYSCILGTICPHCGKFSKVFRLDAGLPE